MTPGGVGADLSASAAAAEAAEAAGRARRAARTALARAEAAAKVLGRRLRDLGPQGLAGYDPVRNPFGDPKLHRRFVWRAKIERDAVEACKAADATLGTMDTVLAEVMAGEGEHEGVDGDAKRKEADVDAWEGQHWGRVAEVARVKRRRLEREAEVARRGEARDVRQRELALAQFLEWERQDEAFHLVTDARRTRARISHGRPRPVDHLARLLLDADELIRRLRDGSSLEGDAADNGRARALDELARGVRLSPSPSNVLASLRGGEDGEGLRDLASDVAERQRTALVNGLDMHAVFWEDVLIACDAMHETGRRLIPPADRDASVAHLDAFHAGLLSRACAEAGIKVHDDGANDAVQAGEAGAGEEEEEGEDGRVHYIDEQHETAPFAGEISATGREGGTVDEHRSRRPRYSNMVVTGYEWNEYNRAHYTKDRPPPRQVRGYRFSVFYPDLAPGMRPTWRLEEDPDQAQPGQGPPTACLRFVAPPGSPYVDLVFRIANSEWNRKRKHGYRDRFADGVLRLNFNFVRLRYTR